MENRTDNQADKRKRAILPPWFWMAISSISGVILAIVIILLLISPIIWLIWSAGLAASRTIAQQTRVAQTSTAQAIAAQTGTAQARAAQASGAQTSTAQAIAQQTGIAQASTAEVQATQTSAAETSVAQTDTAQAETLEAEADEISVAQTGTARAEAEQTSVAQTSTAQAGATLTNAEQTSVAQTSTAQAQAEQTRVAQTSTDQAGTAQVEAEQTSVAQTSTAQARAAQTGTAQAVAAQTSTAQAGIDQTSASQTSVARISTAQAGATQTRVSQTRVAQVRETAIASAPTRTPTGGTPADTDLTPTVTTTPPQVFFLVRGQDYIVQADDWLSKLSNKFYGSPVAYWPIIAATNQANTQDPTYDRVDDPDFIEIGDKLLIPAADIAEDFMENFEIDSGLPESIVDDEGILRIEQIILPTVTPAPSPPPGISPPPLPPTSTPVNGQSLIVPAVPADATPIPPPNGTVALVAPVSLDQPTFGPTAFIWEWNGQPLPPTYSFEVRVWFPGAPPTGVHDAITDSQNGQIEQIGPNRYQLRIGNIRSAEGVQGQAGIYLWTVQLVRVAPDYAEFGLQAEPTQLRIEPNGP